MKIEITSNKQLPLKVIDGVLFQRGKVKPYYLRYGFFIEVNAESPSDFPAIANYVFEIVAQYSNAEVELHSKDSSIYNYFLKNYDQIVYNSGALYFHSTNYHKQITSP